MENFLEDIMTVYWWLTVVIVGIAINVASTYIRSGLANKLGNFSKYWAGKRDSRLKERGKLLSLLKENETALLLYANSESSFRVRALQFLLFFCIFLFIGISTRNHFVFYDIPYTFRSYVSSATIFLALTMLVIAIADTYAAIKIHTNISEAFPESDAFYP